MNIFVTDLDPATAARNQCDAHVRKMIIEYSQMLSTAHRLIDGVLHTYTVKHPHDGKTYRFKHHKLGDEDVSFQWGATPTGRTKLVPTIINKVCHRVAHANHPCSVWVRKSSENYKWLAEMYISTAEEYNLRYGKEHASGRFSQLLSTPPRFIPAGKLTPFAQAMPEGYQHENVVEAYRRFYQFEKARFATWKRGRNPPDWWLAGTPGEAAQSVDSPAD